MGAMGSLALVLLAATAAGEVTRNPTAAIAEAKAVHDARLRKHRGLPWLETNATSAAAFLASRNATMEASRSLLPAALEEAKRLEHRLSLPAISRRWPASLHVRGTFYITAAFKLQHDAEQLRADAILSAPAYDGLYRMSNALLHLPAPRPWTGPVLGDGFLEHAQAIEDAYVAEAKTGKPPATYFDDFLSPEALDELYHFCMDASIWFDVKPGYLGAYFDDGFTAPVLLRVVHADPAAVNVNFWVTPDDANESGDAGGGLVVHRTYRGSEGDWNGIEHVEVMEDHLRRAVANGGPEPLRVPYKRNRCVVFDSSLLHETDDFRFKPGYRNRRINLTFLFGERGQGAVFRAKGEQEKGTRVCLDGFCGSVPLSAQGAKVARRDSRAIANCVDDKVALGKGKRDGETMFLCLGQQLHVRGDGGGAVAALRAGLAAGANRCGKAPAASEPEWRACGSLATILQDRTAASAAFYADALPDVFRWYRHTYYVDDAQLCELTTPELDRWAGAGAPTLLVHVPRTSGTTLRALYAALLGASALAPSRHFTAAQLRRCGGLRNTTTVAVVRDPWARAYSSWTHLRKVAQISEHNSDRFFGTWLHEFETFSAFAETGGLAVAAKMCPHFFPALDYVADPKTGDVLVDEIHLFEQLHAGDKTNLVPLLAATGLLGVARRKNVSASFADKVRPRGGQGPRRHCKHYTRRAADVVAEIYADDISAFDYEFTCRQEDFSLYETHAKSSLTLHGRDRAAEAASRRAAATILAAKRRSAAAENATAPAPRNSPRRRSRAPARRRAPPRVRRRPGERPHLKTVLGRFVRPRDVDDELADGAPAAERVEGLAAAGVGEGQDGLDLDLELALVRQGRERREAANGILIQKSSIDPNRLTLATRLRPALSQSFVAPPKTT
ncbi:hypothetical protein JL720_1398 [Aureococcus anophagefferens]|nr:hypothetical protein JL720_1398 [Aureococcus anophagefferens]